MSFGTCFQNASVSPLAALVTSSPSGSCCIRFSTCYSSAGQKRYAVARENSRPASRSSIPKHRKRTLFGPRERDCGQSRTSTELIHVDMFDGRHAVGISGERCWAAVAATGRQIGLWFLGAVLAWAVAKLRYLRTVRTAISGNVPVRLYHGNLVSSRVLTPRSAAAHWPQ